MTDSVTYTAVQCMLISSTNNAVCIATDNVSTWIPLSLIHGADELALRKAKRGDVITLRIMTWKVKALSVKSI